MNISSNSPTHHFIYNGRFKDIKKKKKKRKEKKTNKRKENKQKKKNKKPNPFRATKDI